MLSGLLVLKQRALSVFSTDSQAATTMNLTNFGRICFTLVKHGIVYSNLRPPATPTPELAQFIKRDWIALKRFILSYVSILLFQ